MENGYCEQHRHLPQGRKSQSNRYYDQYVRDDKVTAFYHSREWLAVRSQVLGRDHGLCQHCLKEGKITIAETVHHIVEIKLNWALRLVLSNLISLCLGCHNKVHGGKSDG